MGWRDKLDDTVRDATGGRVGISDDFTSTEDSGAGEAVDETVDEVQDSGDDALRGATGGRVGVSDDWTSTEDSGAGEAVEETVDKTKDAVDNTTDRADNFIDEKVNDAQKAVDNTVDRADDFVDEKVNDVQKTVDDTVDRADDFVDEKVNDAQKAVDNTADRANDAVDNTIDRTQDTAKDVGQDVQEGVDKVQQRADEEVRDATGGDVGVSQDWTSTEDSGGVRDVADAGLRGATGGRVGVSDDFTSTEDSRVDVNTNVTDDLTKSGGVLSENRNDNSGLLPGEVAGVNLSEEGLRNTSERIDGVKDSFDEGGDFMGSSRAESALQGAAGVGVDMLNVPQHVLTAETGTEVAVNAPGAIDEYGAGTVAGTATGVGVAVGGAMADEARENPIEFVSGSAFGYVTGAAAGRIAGKAGRATRDRVRTAGGTKVDAEGSLAGEDVVRYTETDGAEGQQFPGARDPDTYESDPAKAVQEQADEFTPQQIEGFFDERGVTEGSVLKKALDVEPDGPGKGRSDTGFTSAPDEVDGDFAYETPGSFFGPELSPNFLRVGGGESSFSARPGLPDFGNKPTGVLARTDVENADADTLEEFNQEIMDRSGDTTAVTKPADEVNTGEIEAVVPPGAEFSPVGSGGLSGVARRLGIGSDFYTEVDGRRVPLRPVAPKDRSPDAGTDASDVGNPDGSGSGEPLDYYVENPEQPVDRPLPPAGPGGGTAASEEETTTSPRTFDGPVDELGGFGGFYDAPGDTRGPSSPPSSGPGDGGGPSSTPTSPPLDEFGPTSPPSSPPSSQPPSSGPSSPPLDEFGPTSPPSSPPSSPPGSGGPSSPPSSGPPSSPPGSPPPWSPPGDYDGSSTTSPPGSPGGPGGSSGFGPSPFDPTDQRRRFDEEDKKRKDEEKFSSPELGQYDVAFQNPIASGAQVLFGGSGFGGGFGALDETGGLQDAGGFGDELSQGGMIDETGGFGSFGQPIDETGGLDEWTPF